jgi:hypothetical protein
MRIFKICAIIMVSGTFLSIFRLEFVSRRDFRVYERV